MCNWHVNRPHSAASGIRLTADWLSLIAPLMLCWCTKIGIKLQAVADLFLVFKCNKILSSVQNFLLCHVLQQMVSLVWLQQEWAVCVISNICSSLVGFSLWYFLCPAFFLAARSSVCFSIFYTTLTFPFGICALTIYHIPSFCSLQNHNLMWWILGMI